jgi:hypothetical protein
MSVSKARREVNLPPDFFNLTADELKREQQARSDSSAMKLTWIFALTNFIIHT